MPGNDEKKLAVVRECLLIDNPRSPEEYIASLMAWDFTELEAYLERRKREQASLGVPKFRPHP
ncbi:MAG TPA: hypothetical protein VLT35_03230 [Methanocella sp.]|nr:hypothetical protein [Methanocella sp.]